MRVESSMLIKGRCITVSKSFADFVSDPVATKASNFPFIEPKLLEVPHSERLSESMLHQQHGCLLEWD